MKKLLFALMCVATLASCSLWDAVKYSSEISEGTIDNYDKYPGMNVSELPLTGIPYVWPAATFHLEGLAMGEQNQSREEDQDEDMKVTDDMFGSGLFVIVTLDIKNLTDQRQVLELPRGLLLQSTSSSYQNGILVKKVQIPFKANEERKVSIRFYCLNASLHGSDSGSEYNQLSLVTNVAAFEPLFNVCEEKKINIDEYKTISILSYYGAATTVQEIVWAITKGKIFTEKEIKKYLKHVKKA